MTVLKILYQDDDLVIVSKPEKMLTHRTEIANGDTEFALQIFLSFIEESQIITRDSLSLKGSLIFLFFFIRGNSFSGLEIAPELSP